VGLGKQITKPKYRETNEIMPNLGLLGPQQQQQGGEDGRWAGCVVECNVGDLPNSRRSGSLVNWVKVSGSPLSPVLFLLYNSGALAACKEEEESLVSSQFGSKPMVTGRDWLPQPRTVRVGMLLKGRGHWGEQAG
jgi:hypothetical protein